MASVAVSFTPDAGSPVYSFTFTDFTDNSYPRQYLTEVEFSQSVGGSSIIGGPPFLSKYIWTISSVLTSANAESFDEMYRAWDQDRSNGLTAALGVIDTTFGATVNTSAVISTAPSYNFWGPALTLVSFGMTEV